jgi:hypothetical protein
MFNQNIISNKFDLNLSTTLSSYSVADNIVGVCRVIYAEKFSYPLVNIINFFFFVFENTLLITPGEHFQLKVVIKSTHGKHLCCPHCEGRLWDLPIRIKLGWNCVQGTNNLAYFGESEVKKKFVTLTSGFIPSLYVNWLLLKIKYCCCWLREAECPLEEKLDEEI